MQSAAIYCFFTFIIFNFLILCLIKVYAENVVQLLEINGDKLWPLAPIYLLKLRIVKQRKEAKTELISDDEKTSTDKSDDTTKNKMISDAEAYLRSLAA